MDAELKNDTIKMKELLKEKKAEVVVMEKEIEELNNIPNKSQVLIDLMENIKNNRKEHIKKIRFTEQLISMADFLLNEEEIEDEDNKKNNNLEKDFSQWMK